MEDNNYNDEFELFLKESADEFRMVPSRKVWYSLYNNLHPDRKWPSMAVCLLILTAVLYLGIANNNSLSSAAKKASAENLSYLLNEKNNDSKITFSAKDYLDPKNKTNQNFSIKDTHNESIETDQRQNPINPETKILLDLKGENSFLNTAENSVTLKTTAPVNIYDDVNTYAINNNNQKKADVAKSLIIKEEREKIFAENETSDTVLNTEIITAKSIENETLLQKIDLLNTEKSWKEDYAFRYKPAINKFKQNSTLSYFITPSFGYRSFYKTTESNTTGSSFISSRTNNDQTNLFDNAALNLEAGAILQYSTSEKLRFKAGLQANYTNYISNVTALGHPTQTSISLNNIDNNVRSSNFSTKAGYHKINKNTMQIALPLGADFKIAGNGKLNWYAGGTIQPTYVISGNAFVLSTDEKYYISENALLRKMNLNTAIETFISFKSANGVLLNVGPQFRYQLFSTYKNQYGYAEKIYNVGIKIGVTAAF